MLALVVPVAAAQERTHCTRGQRGHHQPHTQPHTSSPHQQQGLSEGVAHAHHRGILEAVTNRSGWGGTRATALRQLVHHRMRNQWAAHQHVTCPRCGLPVLPGQAWDVGHRIDVTARPDLMFNPANVRAEHADCNRAAGAEQTNAGRITIVEGWRW